MKTVGVVGLGTMGAGIAEVFARAGLDVIGVEADDAALNRGRGHLETSTGKAVARGRLSQEERTAILARVTLSTVRADLGDADLVIEAIPETMDLKRPLFADLDRICKRSAILATNTSSLSVTEIAATTSRPGRVVGLHFFNPAPVMKLVEVVRTILTDDDVASSVVELAGRLGKTPVLAGDRAGFVVNRLLLGQLNQACWMLENGVASRDDIDTAMRVGARLPMGPFALLDLIGLDTSYEICEVLFRETRDRRHAPAPILRELVAAGRLGRKSGGGFHAGGSAPEPQAGPRVPVALLGAPGLADAATAAGWPVVPAEEADAVLVVVGADDVAPREKVVGVRFIGDRAEEGVAEIVSSALTAPAVARAAFDLTRDLGWTPVRCRDRAGGIVEALLFPYINDAVRMVESGYVSAADVDAAMRLGCGHPAGPIEMLGAIGPATVRDGLDALYQEYREPAFAPAPLLDRLVTAGVTELEEWGERPLM